MAVVRLVGELPERARGRDVDHQNITINADAPSITLIKTSVAHPIKSQNR